MEQIRGRIIGGELAPGSQLPSRTEMIKTLGTCKATLQDALNELRRDGFIESRERSGTFVVEKPPHLSRVGVVLGPDPDGLWRAFTEALRREIPGVERERGCRFVLYENVTKHRETAEYRQLFRDIRAHQLAGLIFRGHIFSWGLDETPFMTVPGIPRVVFTGPPDMPGVPRVQLDDEALFDRVLDYLVARGRRRVALINNYELPSWQMAHFLAGVSSRGMAIKSPWIHRVTGDEGRRLTELLMLLTAAERPDALFIADENLTEQVSAGILASGVKAGADIDVVAHANLPAAGPTLVPVKRVGWNMAECLRIFMDLLDRQRLGEEPPLCTKLRPVFEEEVPASVVVP